MARGSMAEVTSPDEWIGMGDPRIGLRGPNQRQFHVKLGPWNDTFWETLTSC
jgi:hypothetical protein